MHYLPNICQSFPCIVYPLNIASVLCFSSWGVQGPGVGPSHLDHVAHALQEHSGGLPWRLPWQQGGTSLPGAQSGVSNSPSQRYACLEGVCDCLSICLPFFLLVCLSVCMLIHSSVHPSVQLPVSVHRYVFKLKYLCIFLKYVVHRYVFRLTYLHFVWMYFVVVAVDDYLYFLFQILSSLTQTHQGNFFSCSSSDCVSQDE